MRRVPQIGVPELEAAVWGGVGSSVTVSTDVLFSLMERVERLEAERIALQNDSRTLTCVFCGVAYPPGTPASNHEALKAHVAECPQHPMAQLRRDLTDIVGAIQRYQPAGSPPPGGLPTLVIWIFQSYMDQVMALTQTVAQEAEKKEVLKRMARAADTIIMSGVVRNPFDVKQPAPFSGEKLDEGLRSWVAAVREWNILTKQSRFAEPTGEGFPREVGEAGKGGKPNGQSKA